MNLQENAEKIKERLDYLHKDHAMHKQELDDTVFILQAMAGGAVSAKEEPRYLERKYLLTCKLIPYIKSEIEFLEKLLESRLSG